ncbi:MAG TPA: dienelactone hydrolase family protein [Acidimicrobiia bacterium]|jgi:carboxymethylenebutenolidase
MAETVTFPSNGNSASGYLATPDGDSGPGVIVVQEWWGLGPGIKEMADRLASAGFVALVPDLFHGELAGHDEVDKAAAMMQALPMDRVARDMSGAVDFLVGDPRVTGPAIGAIGFCMGGGLAMTLGATRPDVVKAVVTFYGIPSNDADIDWAGMTAVVRGHMGGADDFYGPEAVRAVEKKLQDLGKDVQFTVHPGAGHAFMGPHNAFGTLDEELSAKIWPGVTTFLHEQLD